MEILSNNQMKLSVSCLTILLTFFMIFNTSKIEAQALKTVKHVDIKSYAGKWFEIAAYPQHFQKGCHCTTAEYTMTDKGYLIVENKCNKDSITGKLVSIKGKAFVEKNADNAKLKVQFFWPFRANYWIIDLANDYSYAVVSNPNRKYLWILCRAPKMNAQTYQKILNRLAEKGFDLAKLVTTPQILN